MQTKPDRIEPFLLSHRLSFNFWLFSISFWVAIHGHSIILIHSLLILRTLNHTAHTIHICHDIFGRSSAVQQAAVVVVVVVRTESTLM